MHSSEYSVRLVSMRLELEIYELIAAQYAEQGDDGCHNGYIDILYPQRAHKRGRELPMTFFG